MTPIKMRYKSPLLACLLASTSAAVLADWTVARDQHPLTREQRCLLRSDTLTIEDGYGSTPVTLWLDGQRLIVVTRSNLDDSFADIGLRIDEEPVLAPDEMQRDTLLVFRQPYDAIVQGFKAGREATMDLRFWPTWPATQVFSAGFSLMGFTKAYGEFETCLSGDDS